MASKTLLPPKYSITLFFRDEFHTFTPRVGPIHETTKSGESDRTVAKFLLSVQRAHRHECRKGHCQRCPGAMFAKSAWLLDKIPNATAPPELNHDPANGIQFMVPHTRLADYLDASKGELIVVVETIFDMTDQFFRTFQTVQETGKRKRLSMDGNSSERNAKQPKLDPPGPLPNRVYIVPGAADPTAPPKLLSPSVPFGSYPDYPGSVFVDKSRFIHPFELLFCAHFACIVSLPPGTGKTALLTLLIAWYERRNRTLAPSLFQPLEITTLRRKQSKDSESTAWASSVATCLCLIFDLADVDAALNTATVQAINQYLCRTMRAFVAKYQAEFGQNFVLSPAKLQEGDTVGIIKQIIVSIRPYRSRTRLMLMFRRHEPPLDNSSFSLA
ncbi:hypothetical protein C8R46DRAFT_342375 [Mycena filopes]|nr:hypothetical protein C8R46DRAFT_342375 [Mycena filopes]